MSKKGSSAASDPMAGYAAMMQAQAGQQQAQLGQDWLSFAKDQFAIQNERQKPIDELTAKVGAAQLEGMTNANQWASEDRARYKSIFLPLQDKFIDKANNWDSAGNQAKAAAEAKADVANSVAAADQQRQRQMAAMGINPASGRFAGIERAADIEGAVAQAGAQNVARNNLRKEATALQGDAINMGNGLPSQAASSLQLGSGLGSSAEAGLIGANTARLQGVGIMNAGYGGAMGGYKDAGQTWNSIYGNRVDLLNQQDQLNATTTSGLAGGLGSLAGFGLSRMSFMSDENAKEDKREVKGILDALKKMPVEAWRYKEGEGDGGEHVGTYAQDFQKATGLGDGKSINVVDALGVTMGAVKELAEKVETIKGGKDGDEKKPARTAARRPQPKSIMMKAA
ncbi:MAG: tail fiber domain-containing protein [Methylocystis sp.]|uniref:tail fiber domain-containing protein n=1 Tax=Methylocystis sp. TaxID=1911079 RepID=UPI003DA39E5F